ncbi:flagellar export chaperone FliS [Campylobacter sp. RM12327]|uniref:flagellar export chaperone FliS n=1 Tax=Campylobacter sputorum TaxID=206 RepID=UPI000B76D968|nr:MULTISPECIES: flagellar export chaperone FliS [Campylobacter]ASM40210.1 flagellar protein FliS [Campylobacter sputorum]MBE7358496.1 flagellar export chaperone FliS [Campylobacter sp. RM11302]MBF6669739.1 flagellar export chaperone FliS [Campylobacter sp. RM12327]MBF6674973.1 flagellar export chaperone FliS [Campylobacter sp. RM13538]MBF6676327.1 flagellar export chaperone FliS [Campylobacter sp. RM12321]
MQNNLAYSAYMQNSVGIESPKKLIEMLYEGILKFVYRTKKAIEDDDIEAKVYNINRANAIFFELINSLDYNQGDVAHYLAGLYTREIQLLTQANLTNEKANLDEVIHVVKELLEAWKEVTKEDELA